MGYCKFGIFRENFIFANSVKRHICDVQVSRQMYDLPISVNDRVILPFRMGIIFAKLRENKILVKYNAKFREIKPSLKFPFLQYYIWYKLVYLTGYEHMYTCFFVHLSHNAYGFSVHLSGNITPSFQRHTGDEYHMALDARKPDFGVCEQALLKRH